MQAVQILLGDRMLEGKVLMTKADYKEIEVSYDVIDDITIGDYMIVFQKNTKFELRILSITENILGTFPSNSDIFLLGEQKIQLDPTKLYQRFRFETVAVLHQVPVIQKVVINTLDVSRHGVFLYLPQSSMEVNGGPLIMNQQYQSILFCGEQRILPTFIIRRVYPMEIGARYLAEFYAVSQEDIQVLRSFIVSEYNRTM